MVFNDGRYLPTYLFSKNQNRLSVPPMGPGGAVPVQKVERNIVESSVLDPDSFFTDPDPGFFSQSGSRIQATKNKFF